MEDEMQCPLCGLPAGTGMRCRSCDGPLELPGGFALTGTLSARGQSRVLSGTRRSDGLEVAIDVRSLRGAAGGQAREQFERDREMLAALSHPGLLRVFALERDDVGRLYQVHERLRGGTLRERVEAQGGLPSAAVARQVLVGLLRVLQYLQGRVPPLVHGDIEPSNVMFRHPASWEPVLVGLGATGAVDSGYAAPETLGGQPTPASDFYSLAATLAYACTGKEPDELAREPAARAAAFRRLEPPVADVLRRMSQPTPEQRLSSSTEALRMLNRPTYELSHPSEPPRVARLARGALGACVAIVLIGATVWLGGTWRENRFREQMAGVGLDFHRTTDDAVVHTAKRVATVLGMGLDECRVSRHRLHGESYAAQMSELEAIGGMDVARLRNSSDGDSLIVLACDLMPYAWLPVGSRRVAVSFRTRY